LKAEAAAGRRQPPIECDACSQTEGIIERHSEDYSQPFGDHIGKYAVCLTCHTMLHCRFKAPQAWQQYRDAIRGGAVFAPLSSRNFRRFTARFLGGALPQPVAWREPQRHTFLDDLEMSPAVQTESASNPILKVDGDPATAVRKVAGKAVAALRVAPVPTIKAAEALRFRAGAKRSNEGLDGVVSAL
jgi:hypothetical protein